MARVVLGMLTVCAGATLLSFRPIYEPDLGWHLAQGREALAAGPVRANTFSFTYPDYRQRYTPWLFDLTAYLAWRAGGGAGVQVFQAGWLTLALLLLYGACRIRAPAWSATAVLLLGLVILEPRAIPRPHLVSFAGVAACALLVERASVRRSAAPLWWGIPVVALWSNLHVECVFGVLLLAIFAASEIVRPAVLARREALRAAGIVMLCALATLGNPYGWGLLGYLYENLSVPRLMAIAELRPPYLPAYRAFYAYVVVTALLLALHPRRLRLSEAMAAVSFSVLGARYLRLTPLVLLATAPMVAARLPLLAARGIDRRAIVITALCAAVALSRIPVRLLATELAVGTAAVAPRQFFSPDAVSFIERAGLRGPAFNSHNLGGYLAWTLYPSVLIFQDSRLQAYPPEHFSAIMRASRDQREWDLLVAGLDWAVISVPRPNQLSGHGRFPPAEWGTVFRDEAMEVMVRRGGRYAHLLDHQAGEQQEIRGRQGS